MDEFETFELMNVLKNIRDESRLDNFLKNNNIAVNLPTFFNKICTVKKIKKSDLIKNSYISRTYCYQILDGTKKPSRNNIIRLCISAKLDLTDINKALKLGNSGELYPKNSRDSIIIFGINKNLDVLKINELLYDRDFETLI